MQDTALEGIQESILLLAVIECQRFGREDLAQSFFELCLQNERIICDNDVNGNRKPAAPSDAKGSSVLNLFRNIFAISQKVDMSVSEEEKAGKLFTMLRESYETSDKKLISQKFPLIGPTVPSNLRARRLFGKRLCGLRAFSANDCLSSFCVQQLGRRSCILGHKHTSPHSTGTTNSPARVTCLRIEKIWNRLLTGGDDGLIKIWSINTGKLQMTLRRHFSEISNLEVSPCGKIVVSTCCMGQVRFWKLSSTSWEQLAFFDMEFAVSKIQFTPEKNGQSAMILAGDDGLVRIYSTLDLLNSPTPYLCEPSQVTDLSKLSLRQGAILQVQMQIIFRDNYYSNVVFSDEGLLKKPSSSSCLEFLMVACLTYKCPYQEKDVLLSGKQTDIWSSILDLSNLKKQLSWSDPFARNRNPKPICIDELNGHLISIPKDTDDLYFRSLLREFNSKGCSISNYTRQAVISSDSGDVFLASLDDCKNKWCAPVRLVSQLLEKTVSDIDKEVFGASPREENFMTKLRRYFSGGISLRTYKVNCVAWSAEDEYIYFADEVSHSMSSGTTRKTVRQSGVSIFNSYSGKRVSFFQQDKQCRSSISCIACHPTFSAIFAFSTHAGQIFVCEGRHGSLLKRIDIKSTSFLNIMWSPSGDTLFAGSSSGCISFITSTGGLFSMTPVSHRVQTDEDGNVLRVNLRGHKLEANDDNYETEDAAALADEDDRREKIQHKWIDMYSDTQPEQFLSSEFSGIFVDNQSVLRDANYGTLLRHIPEDVLVDSFGNHSSSMGNSKNLVSRIIERERLDLRLLNAEGTPLNAIRSSSVKSRSALVIARLQEKFPELLRKDSPEKLALKDSGLPFFAKDFPKPGACLRCGVVSGLRPPTRKVVRPKSDTTKIPETAPGMPKGSPPVYEQYPPRRYAFSSILQSMEDRITQEERIRKQQSEDRAQRLRRRRENEVLEDHDLINRQSEADSGIISTSSVPENTQSSTDRSQPLHEVWSDPEDSSYSGSSSNDPDLEVPHSDLISVQQPRLSPATQRPRRRQIAPPLWQRLRRADGEESSEASDLEFAAVRPPPRRPPVRRPPPPEPQVRSQSPDDVPVHRPPQRRKPSVAAEHPKSETFPENTADEYEGVSIENGGRYLRRSARNAAPSISAVLMALESSDEELGTDRPGTRSKRKRDPGEDDEYQDAGDSDFGPELRRSTRSRKKNRKYFEE
eukprot:GHVP01070572.1.p1 GENE.GHVP01070572.1~~GHVP01070572.1.p1  ORF type:complete len:1204 (+),score=235.21 GHVP01070572.1:45-3656(+)